MWKSRILQVVRIRNWRAQILKIIDMHKNTAPIGAVRWAFWLYVVFLFSEIVSVDAHTFLILCDEIRFHARQESLGHIIKNRHTLWGLVEIFDALDAVLVPVHLRACMHHECRFGIRAIRLVGHNPQSFVLAIAENVCCYFSRAFPIYGFLSPCVSDTDVILSREMIWFSTSSVFFFSFAAVIVFSPFF